MTKRINRKEIISMLQEVVPHLNHTEQCNWEMVSHGEPCWCGIRFNSVVGKPILTERVKQLIDKLKE